MWGVGGESDAANPRVSTKGKAEGGLSVDMLDLPFAVDAPSGETVVVLIGERVRTLHRLFGYAAQLTKSARSGCTAPKSSQARLVIVTG